MGKTLTPKQNAVIWCLQNGWILITDSEIKGALVCTEKFEYRINNGLFYRLVEMGLIYQGDWHTHIYNFVLTEKGKNIKTKPINITKGSDTVKIK